MSEQAPDFLQFLLAEAGYQVTAVDYTEEMLKEAQSNAGGAGRSVLCGKQATRRRLMWKATVVM